MSNPNLFESGVAAALSGNREEARNLMMKVVEKDPYHEEAWIWLCDLVDEPEDRIIALENALNINPGNQEARLLLDTLRAARAEASKGETPGRLSVFSAVPTEPIPSHAAGAPRSILAGASAPTTPVKDRRVLQARFRSRLMAVHRALNATDRDTALNILVEAVEEDENNEPAWILLGHMAPTLDDQRIALENALILNPGNSLAAQRLESLDPGSRQEPTQMETEELVRMVEGFIEVPQEEKKQLEAFEGQLRKEVLQTPANSDDQKQPDTTYGEATRHLLRTALWPTASFFVLAVIYSLLKPLGFTPLLIPGVLSVAAGSMLAAAVSLNPRHPLWVEFFGEPGERMELFARVVFGLLGWILALTPFLLLLVHALPALRPL